jgi:hypothetical protein
LDLFRPGDIFPALRYRHTASARENSSWAKNFPKSRIAPVPRFSFFRVAEERKKERPARNRGQSSCAEFLSAFPGRACVSIGRKSLRGEKFSGKPAALTPRFFFR